ncbi:methyltransferase domain-containing protein [Helicobacter sp. 23-1048]
MLAKRFAKRAPTYAKHAIIQRAMAEELANIFVAHKRERKNLAIFEFGSAFGEFSTILCHALKRAKIKCSTLLCNDINDYGHIYTKAFAKNLEVENLAFQCFDMNEGERFLDSLFDVIASNACLQWLNQQEVLLRLKDFLLPNGEILLSSFGKNNLWQVREICGVGLEYLDLELYEKMLSPHFKIIRLYEKQYDLDFKESLEVFRHLSQSGVNALTKDFVLTKSLLKHYQERFGGVLSFHSIFIHAQKL